MATSATLEASPKPKASRRSGISANLRDRKQRGDERIDEDAHRPEHGHEQPDRDRRHGTDDIAEDNAVERDGDVPFELAAAGELDETLRDVARRGDEAAIADADHQQNLPDNDEPDRRDQIKQTLARLGGHLDLHGSLSSRRVGQNPTILRSCFLVAARARDFGLQDLPDVELEA